MDAKCRTLESAEVSKTLTQTFYRLLLHFVGDFTEMPSFMAVAWAQALMLVLADVEAYNDSFEHDPERKH